MIVAKYLISRRIILSNAIVYIGNNTIQILTWHFLCFKIVSLIIILVYHLPIEHLAEFPTISDYSASGWRICYFLIGILIPVIGTLVITKLKTGHPLKG